MKRKTMATLLAALAVSTAAAENISITSIPVAGNFYAGDYTLSFVITDADAISTGTILLAYWGSNAAADLSANAFTFSVADEDSITLNVGVGSIASTSDLGTATFVASSDSNRSVALTGVDGASYSLTTGVVYTLSVVGANGTQTVSLLADGETIATATYNGNMNNSVENTMNAAMNGAVATNDTSVVPEPATATLSLLALAGLAARRRRK